MGSTRRRPATPGGLGPDPDDPDGTPINCDEANVTLTPSADGWADQVNPLENYWTMTELSVRSEASLDTGTGVVTPENARAFFRFPLQSDAPDCELVSASLRLYADGFTEDRTLTAVPLAETWKESTLTWVSQPDPVAGAVGATTAVGRGLPRVRRQGARRGDLRRLDAELRLGDP